jgi:hypothetical protein
MNFVSSYMVLAGLAVDIIVVHVERPEDLKPCYCLKSGSGLLQKRGYLYADT